MSHHHHHRALALVLFCALLVVAAFQGTRGLYHSTEGRYAECARQTALTGNWAVPVLNGENHWTKPPLTYMCIGAGLSLLGTNTWGARFFLVPAFFLTVVLVYGLGSLLWGREAALYGAMVYATSPFTVVAANVISTDTLMVFWQACGMFLFWCALRTGKGRFVLMMWAALGLGFVTKGPASLIPLFGILPVHALSKRRDPSVPRLFTFWGLVLFFVLGGGWYLVEGLRFPGLLRYWVVDEIVKRNVEGEFKRNPQFYYALLIYVPILLFGTGPWAVLLFVKRKALPGIIGGWRDRFRGTDGLAWAFLVLTLLPPLVLFSLSTSKLPLYMLPLFVPLALALGRGIQWLTAQGHLSRRATFTIFLVLVALSVSFKGASACWTSSENMKQLSARINPLIGPDPQALPVVFDILYVPWYGLQFYQDRVFPVAAYGNFEELIDRETASPGGSVTFLMRARDFPVFETGRNVASCRTFPVEPYWLRVECRGGSSGLAPDAS